jgi:sortase A
MTTATVLRSLERALLAAGLALAIWCGAVLLDAHFVAQMPLPNPPKAAAASAPVASVTPGVVIGLTPIAGSWVARLDAPSVRLSATVLEGSDDATLARGAGHIEDTPFPGQPGNIGIAGHRDTTFRAVRNLHVGDPLELTTSDWIYRYLITKAFIVEPEDVYVLDPGDGPMLTLVTCYPFTYVGHAPHRYILQAALVDQVARIQGAGKAGEAGMARQ